jgi:hypothetical protein
VDKYWIIAKRPNFEVENIRFLKEKTSLPLPKIVESRKEDNGCYFMLNGVWSTLCMTGKERIAKQTAEHIFQLRELRSSQM